MDVTAVEVLLRTFCASGAEVLVTKLTSPLYVAVIDCTPAASAPVVQVAVPAADTVWAPHPAMSTPPSWKSTVPVRVPAAGAVAFTVAVKVTLTPVLDGLSDDTIVVVVAPWLTTCVSVDDVEALKLMSPL